MRDRTRLREALAAALAAAQEARAPDRVLALLRGAYRSLDSANFVDDDMIRWAQAGLGAWRRWSSADAPMEHQLLVVDPTGSIADTLRAAAAKARISRVEVVASRSATLEALATRRPTALVFDLDAAETAPTVELLDWLSTEFPHIRRIGCTHSVEAFAAMRERGLYHAILPKPPTSAQVAAALPADIDSSPSPR